MINYYTLLLTLTLLLQKNTKGVYLTLLALFMVVGGDSIITGFREQGYTLYESVVRLELLSLFLCSISVGLHKNKYIFWIIVASFLYNYTFLCTDSMEVKYFIYDHYKTVNTILFECMLALCFADTRLYYYFKNKVKMRGT